MPALSLRVSANGAVRLDETILGDIEQRRFLLVEHPLDKRRAVQSVALADREELKHVGLRLGERSPAFLEAALLDVIADLELAAPTLRPALDVDGMNGEGLIEA